MSRRCARQQPGGFLLGPGSENLWPSWSPSSSVFPFTNVAEPAAASISHALVRRQMMRYRSVFRLCLLLLVITLAVPQLAHAQSAQSGKRDRLWNGMLIGAGVGAVAGMLVAPQALCGSN